MGFGRVLGIERTDAGAADLQIATFAKTSWNRVYSQQVPSWEGEARLYTGVSFPALARIVSARMHGEKSNESGSYISSAPPLVRFVSYSAPLFIVAQIINFLPAGCGRRTGGPAPIPFLPIPFLLMPFLLGRMVRPTSPLALVWCIAWCFAW
jgi:hypothetical protein